MCKVQNGPFVATCDVWMCEVCAVDPRQPKAVAIEA